MLDSSRRSVYGGAQVLILGVSARAAAYSALRAGLAPAAADFFQDQDLAAVCDCRRIGGQLGELERVVPTFPNCPWLYTGGLENHPDLVDRLAQQRELYGNPGRVLRAVRNPFLVAETLRAAGLPSLPVLAELPPGVPGAWLRKPRDSGGGQGIGFARPNADQSAVVCRRDVRWLAAAPGSSGGCYYQQYVSGTPCSAVFVAARGQAVWLGTTCQLIGTPWAGAQGFQYVGSLGPLDVPPAQQRLWERIGNCLVDRFELRGLFGVDAVLADDAVWVVEVNPRYTASIEVLELATGLATLGPHVTACRDGELPAAWLPASGQRVGKAIVYARHAGRVPDDFAQRVRRLNQNPARPTVADIPPAGQPIAAGDPVVTVLAYGSSLAAVTEALQQQVATVQTSLLKKTGTTTNSGFFRQTGHASNAENAEL